MFNVENFATVAQEVTLQSAEVLQVEQVKANMLAEAVFFMAKATPKREQSEAIQARVSFNATLAKLVNEKGATAEAMECVLVPALQKIGQRLGSTSASSEEIEAARQHAFHLVGFFESLTQSIVRNGFYLHRRAEDAEAASLRQGGGVKLPLETRTEYAGWGRPIIEPDAVIDATDEAVKDLAAIAKFFVAYVPQGLASRFLTAGKDGEVECRLQTGYQAGQGADDAQTFYSRQDAWKAMAKQANRPRTSQAETLAFMGVGQAAKPAEEPAEESAE